LCWRPRSAFIWCDYCEFHNGEENKKSTNNEGELEKWPDDHRYPQKANAYKDTILDLRHDHRLHEFVEWAVKRVIDSKFENRFSIQPEKYGISNGRIDMALYHTPRTVIHFELIATCSNGHVFRDTSSLLASRADEKLAILIDQDLIFTVDGERKEAAFPLKYTLHIVRPRPRVINRSLGGSS
jgi:hypothetical protein